MSYSEMNDERSDHYLSESLFDTFILDFEKGFDTPPHELLKSKLYDYGIGGKTLK